MLRSRSGFGSHSAGGCSASSLPEAAREPHGEPGLIHAPSVAPTPLSLEGNLFNGHSHVL